MQLFSVLQVKVLMTVGVPSDLQGSWNLLPIPRVDAPAEPCLSLQGCLALFAVIESILVAVWQIKFIKLISCLLLLLG